MAGSPWLLVAYPIAVHLGIVFERPAWIVSALAVIAAGVAVRLLWQRRSLVAGGVLAGSGALFVVVGQGWAHDLLLLPPVVFSLLFLVLFGSSLLPGQEPLVTRLAIRMGEDPSVAMVRYTRRVTLAWTLFFAGLLGLSIGMALWASPLFWSLFVNIGSYALVAAFFIGEFQLRHRILPGHRFARLGDFLRALAAHRGGWAGRS